LKGRLVQEGRGSGGNGPGMVTYTDMDITIVPPGHRVPAVAVIPWKWPSDIPWVPGSKGVNNTSVVS